MFQKTLLILLSSLFLVPAASMADGLVLVKFENHLPSRVSRPVLEPTNLTISKAVEMRGVLTYESMKAALVGKIILSQKKYRTPDVIQINTNKVADTAFSGLKNPLFLSFLIDDESYNCAADMELNLPESKVTKATIVCQGEVEELLGFKRINVTDFIIK